MVKAAFAGGRGRAAVMGLGEGITGAASNSSSELRAKTAFGTVHRERLCDNEP